MNRCFLWSASVIKFFPNSRGYSRILVGPIPVFLVARPTFWYSVLHLSTYGSWTRRRRRRENILLFSLLTTPPPSLPIFISTSIYISFLFLLSTTSDSTSFLLHKLRTYQSKSPARRPSTSMLRRHCIVLLLGELHLLVIMSETWRLATGVLRFLMIRSIWLECIKLFMRASRGG